MPVVNEVFLGIVVAAFGILSAALAYGSVVASGKPKR